MCRFLDVIKNPDSYLLFCYPLRVVSMLMVQNDPRSFTSHILMCQTSRMKEQEGSS